MIREILLVHHTHTDIGYTHPQPVVFELHRRFIEQALDLADAGAGERDDARFRWTCEVTGTTRAWWEAATNDERDRFLAAVQRGQIEVAALEWHLTPLADLRMLVRSLANVRFFRDLGVPVRSAMNTDVNGVPWGLVDVLHDHGIDGFSMASNSHFGAPVHPRPGAFRWASPEGRELTVWNGFQYWHAANVLLRMPSGVDEVAEVLPAFLAEAEQRGYALPFLPLQITNPHHPDNATPDPTLAVFVRAWNDRDPDVRIRTVLLSEMFDRLREQNLPVLSGDWTDYWNFGAGSSARETTVLMEGLRTLDAAHQTTCWPGVGERRDGEHLDAAHAGLALYAEHTWGADRSVSIPESIETRMQWAGKSAYVYDGLGHARIVLRDGLHALAKRAGGEEPTLLLYNPLPVPFVGPVRLPKSGLDWAITPGIHHVQRMDGSLSDLSEETTAWASVEVPPLGYRTYPVADLPLASSEGLAATGDWLTSSRVALEFLPEGGVRSLRVDGIEYAGQDETLTFGVPVLERPKGGSRRDIMLLDFSRFEPAEGWVPNWERETVTGTLKERSSREVVGAVEHRQAFAMDNGDEVVVVYRLLANDASVDVEVELRSAGDSRPYSLGLPFVMPEAEDKTWHFDTAGAVVEFDREQLPNAARHFITARRFVRAQTATVALSIATPDLPLWMFGGMFFAPSDQLSAADRRSVTVAWLANNYWEVNFLANQTGLTRYRLRLLPHAPEPVMESMQRALPYTVPPRLHAYRSLGPVARYAESLLHVEGATLEVLAQKEDGALLVLQNDGEESVTAFVRPGVVAWEAAWQAGLDGTTTAPIDLDSDGSVRVDIAARGVVGVRVTGLVSVR